MYYNSEAIDASDEHKHVNLIEKANGITKLNKTHNIGKVKDNFS